jgi:hypothetical protein
MKPTSPQVSFNWIVGKRVDLAAFIGGALAGYMVFFMHAGLGWDMLLIYLLFITFLDTPHFFGTYLRTYLDRAEFRVRRRFLLGSLLWLVAGPLVLLVCYGLYAAGVGRYMIPFDVFVLAVGIWAYWHVVRQHYGFMRLYQVKNGETALVDRRRDGLLMHLGLMLPFVVFVLRHPESRQAFGLAPQLPFLPSLAQLGGWSGVISGSWIGRISWQYFVIAGCAIAVAALIVDFVVRQAGKWRRGEPLNAPKILLFTAVLPLHILVCFSAAVLTAPLITFSAFVTIYHDIQYHVLVYCHQQNRFRDKEVARESGLAAMLSRNVVVFGCTAIAFGVLVRGFGCSVQIFNGAQCFTPTLISKVHLFGTVSSDTLLGAFFLGFPCHHYFVDQFIWKPSKDKGLRRDLKLEPAGAPAPS